MTAAPGAYIYLNIFIMPVTPPASPSIIPPVASQPTAGTSAINYPTHPTALAAALTSVSQHCSDTFSPSETPHASALAGITAVSMPMLMPIYNPRNDGLYPIRDKDGPLRIKIIKSLPSEENRSCQPVIPFICESSERDRRKLYHENLAVEKFTSDDLRALDSHPARLHCEKKLLGQDKVVARRFLPKGRCIGVYGGQVIDEEERQRRPFIEQSYMAQAGENAWIFGDGIIAKINTNFEFNPSTGYKQSDTGYNLENLRFIVKTNSQKFPILFIAALFTTTDVQVGEELRWNYGCHPEGIKTSREGLSKDAGGV